MLELIRPSLFSRMRPLHQLRDIPDAIDVLKLILAQPQIHLLQLQSASRPKAFLQSTCNRCCFGQRLLALWRLRHPLKELRLLPAVELIERFEYRLALRR